MFENLTTEELDNLRVEKIKEIRVKEGEKSKQKLYDLRASRLITKIRVARQTNQMKLETTDNELKILNSYAKELEIKFWQKKRR